MHISIGYLLAVAFAAIPIGVLIGGVVPLDVPFEAGGEQIFEGETSFPDLEALGIALIFAFGAIIVSTIVPFVLWWLVAYRFRVIKSYWYLLGGVVIAVLAAIIGALIGSAASEQWDGLFDRRLLIALIPVAGFGLGAGLIYFMYMKRRWPIADWIAEAKTSPRAGQN